MNIKLVYFYWIPLQPQAKIYTTWRNYACRPQKNSYEKLGTMYTVNAIINAHA